MMKNNKETVVNGGTAHNALAPGTTVKGNIHAEEDLRIDGKIEGLIECAGRVVVGPQAEITGDIHSTNVDIMGKVMGNLVIKDTLSMKTSSNFAGDALVGRLEVEPGAVFNGTCKMQ
jgi:cytoskeletal protein CcmA (bactofilin family)